MFLHEEFDTEEGETIVRQVRMHWFFLVSRLIPFFLMALLPFLLPLVLHLVPPLAGAVGDVSFATPLARLALGTWWILLWTAAWNTFTKAFLNVWIITDRRIVEIEQKAYFRREVSSLLLDRVQDVTIEVNGVADSLLGIGDINVQTAGAEERFTMDNVPSPNDLRDLIMNHVAAAPRAPL